MSHDHQTFLHSVAVQSDEVHRTPSVQVHGGGVVRVQHGVPAASPMQAPQDSYRVHTGPIKLSMSPGGVVTDAGVIQHAHSDSGTAGGSVMATLRSGANASVETEPGNPASRTSVAVAARMGLIELREGRYQDAGANASKLAADSKPSQATLDAAREASQAELAKAEETQHRADTEGVFNAVEDEAWRNDMAEVPDHAFRAASASAMRAVVLNEGLEGVAKVLSQNTGMDPAAALAKVQDGIWAQTQIVERAIGKVGIDLGNVQEFYAACHANPAELQNAIGYLVHGRDVRPFQKMAREFVARKARGG